MPNLWPDQHPLDSAIWKIDWSKGHIDSIDSLIRAWHALDENDVRLELNSDKTFWEYSIGAVRPPPINIALHAGEFAYQLRSALDQLIYGLSVFPDGLSDRDREAAEATTSFPVLRAANEGSIEGRLKYVPKEIREAAREAIDSVQPYNNGNIYADELMLLDRINARDKHRLLQAAAGNLDILDADWKPGMWIAEGSLKNGDVFFRVPAALDPEVEFDNHFSRDITFRIPGPVGNVSAWRLRDIYRRVALEVLPKFLSLCPPLPDGVSAPEPIPDFQL
jgi:hypothetical protein